MKKRLIYVIMVLLMIVPIHINANIICNDGSVSKTCRDCHQGCCSHHGGCASSGSRRSSESSNNSVYESKSSTKVVDYESVRSSNSIYNMNDEEKEDDSSTVTGLTFLGIIGAIIYGVKKKKR